MPSANLPEEEQHFLARAAQYLENPGFLMKLAGLVGQPLQLAARAVPEGVHKVVETAIAKTLEMAIRTVPRTGGNPGEIQKVETSSYWSGLWHQLAAGATGFAGGLLGLPGLAVELPISTGVMFRSIASIADDFGEDLGKLEVRLECLTIFSYGGPVPTEVTESTYLTTRLGFSVLVQQSAQFIAKTSSEEIADLIAKGSAPALVRLMGQVAARFNLTVSQKLLALAIPMLSAAGGAFVNLAFMEHFNTVARYHFGIRKLERQYGTETVQTTYLDEVKKLKMKSRPSLVPF